MKVTLIALFLLVSASVFSQDDEEVKPFNFGFGTAISLPLGELKESAFIGLGVEIQPSYAISEGLEVFVQTGIHVFRDKSSYGDANMVHLPLLAGARLKLGGIFVGGGAGYGLWMANNESVKGLMYSPQIGYDLGKLEIGLNYTNTSLEGGRFTYFGIKLFRKL